MRLGWGLEIEYRCNTPQHTATRCIVIAPLPPPPSCTQSLLASSAVPKYAATHRTTLHHTAPHCTTLQDTARHCSTLQCDTFLAINRFIAPPPPPHSCKQTLLASSAVPKCVLACLHTLPKPFAWVRVSRRWRRWVGLSGTSKERDRERGMKREKERDRERGMKREKERENECVRVFYVAQMFASVRLSRRVRNVQWETKRERTREGERNGGRERKKEKEGACVCALACLYTMPTPLFYWWWGGMSEMCTHREKRKEREREKERKRERENERTRERENER